MTMPSPFELQKWMAQMKKENCKVIILEVTSEGIKQYRNLNIAFSAGIFTNLTPEHLSSHNHSFSEYKNEKKKFFKQLENENSELILVNADNKYAAEFYNYNIKNKIKVSLENNGDLNAEISEIEASNTKFIIENEEYNIGIGGDKNVENALFAVAIGKYFKLNATNIKKGLNSLNKIPGRMEKINIGQKFSVFVDYAHEEQSINFLMRMGEEIRKKQKSGKIIVLLGAEGGGRDKRKRKIMGDIVGEKANIVIVSNVDPYEDDPKEICEDIAKPCENKNKIRDKDLFVIEDRRNAINKALSIANEKDIVFITGKGSEQSITINGKKDFWDDRIVVKEELYKIYKK
jgi:UDP-N-acetylmuramoyl-L-alanyl-D-glutamate--2,6-diaminopimelate ligase